MTDMSSLSNPPQSILVLQQNGSGQKKIAGVQQYGRGMITLAIYSIDEPLPPIIEDSDRYLPATIEADLVLDYLKHPDLSHDLAARCAELGIPVVASGKKIPGRSVLTPPTCCGLPDHPGLGVYGRCFGAPELTVELADGKIQAVKVVRGAPCGATWDASRNLRGVSVLDAPRRIGLEVQFFCCADPSGWDPIHGKSPVHFAGKVHEQALASAIAKAKANRY